MPGPSSLKCQGNMYHNRKVRLRLNLNEMFDEFPATFVATKEVGETKGKKLHLHSFVLNEIPNGKTKSKLCLNLPQQN